MVKETTSPEAYVTSSKGGKAIDPEIRIMERYGFKVIEPPVIYKDYLEEGGDPRSCGLSVLIEILFEHPLEKVCNTTTP